MRSSLQLLCIEPILSMTDRIFERFVVIKERLSSTVYVQLVDRRTRQDAVTPSATVGEKCHTDASQRKFRH